MNEQGPGSKVSAEQIRARLEIVAPFAHAVRSFSCTDGHEQIPGIAKSMGLRTMVGIWLDDDLEKNELELANALDIARSGHVDILAVGNEVLLRGDLTEDQLLDYMQRAKQGAPDVDVGYVDAYFKFVDHPRVTEACDVVLANCYPFWEGYPTQHALVYMKAMYHRAVAAANGKKVIISETGWPNVGTAEGEAVPSYEAALKYFVDTYQWAEAENIDIYYFSAFDETWKVAAEGDVGAYWGLWDGAGQPKYF
ncbi:MAG: glycosyl hydrolase [Gammaproteobacteria bacterium]|nr:glycosyl hydrolase [Gammaproteobacteria bacterium]NND53846.1 glycosyl hydrolase [Gammaproteobacteria bacterium]